MARKKNSKFAAVLFGPALVVAGVLALWENEGRFDYYAAARDATVIPTPMESPVDAIAYTNSLRTDIPIRGDYVTRFAGYHLVQRDAEIYSWNRSTDSDGDTTWSSGWYSSLESNSRNSGLRQELRSGQLYPDRYELGSLTIDPTDIHFVDAQVPVPTTDLVLNDRARALGLRRSGSYLMLSKGEGTALGDERVSYRAVPNAPTASFFGVISGGLGMARRYEQNDGFISKIIANDGILHHLVNGERAEALGKIRADLSRKTWLVRIGGTVAIVMGFLAFFSVFASLLYRVPLLGRVVQGGVFLVSLAIGLPLALIVILSALLFHNPITVALPLALLIGGIVWFLRRSREAGRNARTALEQRKTMTVPALTPPPAPPTAPPPQAPPPARTGMALIEDTFVNLAVLSLAEGELSRTEQRFLSRWGKDNGVSADRMKELFDVARKDPPEAHHASRDDLEVLALMAMVDGVLTNPEWRYLSKIGDRLGVAHAELRRMLQAIERGQLAPA